MNRKLGVLIAVYAAVLAINLDTTIVNVALPTISRELSTGTRGLQWIVDGYNLAFAALVLAAGSLSDRYGRRPALIVGLLGFALASVAGAMASSVGQLVAARVVMGMFAALIFPTTLSIIRNTFDDRRERAAALGGWGAVVGVGVATGPVTGGLLLTHFYWGSVFLALVPLALLAAGLAVVLVPESRDLGVPALDRRGLVISVGMLSLLTYTIIEAPSRGWSSLATLAGFVGAAVLVFVFVVVERRAAHPMLDVRLFRDRRFSAASAAVMITFFALFGFIFVITQYFQLVRGYDALSTGARILPVAISIAVASVVGGALAPRIGTRAVVTFGLVLFGSAFLWVSTASVGTPYATVIVTQMVMMGLGMGFISTPATESIMLVLPPARAGVGSAVNDATRELGGTLGVAVVGSVFSSVFAAHLASSAFSSLPALGRAQDSVGVAIAMAQGSPELTRAAQDAFMAGMHASCLMVGIVCLVGAVGAVFALPGRVARRTDERVAVAVAA
jgi:EmrB/QacA subfamily drug resistance transporter